MLQFLAINFFMQEQSDLAIVRDSCKQKFTSLDQTHEDITYKFSAWSLRPPFNVIIVLKVKWKAFVKNKPYLTTNELQVLKL